MIDFKSIIGFFYFINHNSMAKKTFYDFLNLRFTWFVWFNIWSWA